MQQYLIDAVLETEETERRRQVRKANRKRALAIEAIQRHIVVGDIKRAVDIAEVNGIDSKEFGKIVKSLNK